MKLNINHGGLFLLGILVTTNGFTEEYDFEIGLAFDQTKYDGSQSITTPVGSIFSSTSIDTDLLSAFGTWYFAGLSDDTGPKARAEFVDRASSLRFGYSHSEQTASFFRSVDDPLSPIPPLDAVVDENGNLFAADVRYVDRDSGWFGNAGLMTSSFTPFGQSGTTIDSNDATGWTLGIGKYIFETTALSLDVSEIDSDGGTDASLLAVNFTHLGSVGERWQYAIDLGYSRLARDRGVDLDTWGASLALYPTRDFEFGIRVEDESSDGTTFADLDTTSFQGFASWYVTPRIQLSAHYSVDDVGYLPDVSIDAPTVSDADQDSIGISATIRF